MQGRRSYRTDLLRFFSLPPDHEYGTSASRGVPFTLVFTAPTYFYFY